VGVDGSEDSRRALKYLKQFPFSSEVVVTAVHVVHLPSPAFGDVKGYYETAELGGELERLQVASEVVGKKILEEATASMKGVFNLQTLVTAGPPARKLVDLAAETNADLILVGSRGLSGVERFIMGSVSLQVCLDAPCSVLIVRE
jgi:nucleotide-binding universal stress UspA family protein